MAGIGFFGVGKQSSWAAAAASLIVAGLAAAAKDFAVGHPEKLTDFACRAVPGGAGVQA